MPFETSFLLLGFPKDVTAVHKYDVHDPEILAGHGIIRSSFHDGRRTSRCLNCKIVELR